MRLFEKTIFNHDNYSRDLFRSFLIKMHGGQLSEEKHTLYSKLLIHVRISQLAQALLPRTYHLMPIVEYMLLECPIKAQLPQMGRSDWTLLTTSVSLLASSDMYVAIGQVQEYSA
jgi:hypothetical protein